MTEPAATSEEEQPKRKRLTPEEWREIEVHWEYGTMSTTEICKKFDITASAVTQHFAKLAEKGTIINKGAKKAQAVAAATASVIAAANGTAVEAVSEFEKKRKERIEQTKEMLYRSSQVNHALINGIHKEVLAKTLTLEGANTQIKTIRMIEAALKLNRENRYALLDIANDIDERDLPTLVFEDLTQDEIKAIQEGSDEDDDIDLTIPALPDEDDVTIETEAE